MAKRLAGRIALCASLLATPAWAEPPPTAVIGTPPQPTWSQLTPAQRSVLAPLSVDWDKMENLRRKKWLLIAERFPTLKPDEQRRIQDRMREWALLSPEQRAKVRDSYKEFNQLPAEQKKAVKEKWETYSNLSDEEKARLKHGGKPPKPAEATPTADAATPPAAGTPVAASPEPAKP